MPVIVIAIAWVVAMWSSGSGGSGSAHPPAPASFGDVLLRAVTAILSLPFVVLLLGVPGLVVGAIVGLGVVPAILRRVYAAAGGPMAAQVWATRRACERAEVARRLLGRYRGASHLDTQVLPASHEGEASPRVHPRGRRMPL
jgi:hypothetical protein